MTTDTTHAHQPESHAEKLGGTGGTGRSRAILDHPAEPTAGDMSLRTFVATHAMKALIRNQRLAAPTWRHWLRRIGIVVPGRIMNCWHDPKATAEQALVYADALLVELAKERP